MTDEHWQRLNQLFHLALERPSSDRGSFLDAECAGDRPDGHAVAQAPFDGSVQRLADGYLDAGHEGAKLTLVAAGRRAGISAPSEVEASEDAAFEGGIVLRHTWNFTNCTRAFAPVTDPAELVGATEVSA